jgi:CheY-like chemotaxis protein
MEPAADTLTERTQPVSNAPFRIAMADDDRAEHLLLMMAADEAGIDAQLSFHDGGQQLLDQLRTAADSGLLPDVILLDLRMPGTDGYAALDELQADPDLGQIPVVVFTSSTRPVERALSYDRGARLFQTKPHDFSKLVSLVRGLPLLAMSPNRTAPEADRRSDDPTRPWIDRQPPGGTGNGVPTVL